MGYRKPRSAGRIYKYESCELWNQVRFPRVRCVSGRGVRSSVAATRPRRLQLQECNERVAPEFTLSTLVAVALLASLGGDMGHIKVW